MSIPQYFELEGGDRLPRVGFGTWQVKYLCLIMYLTLICGYCKGFKIYTYYDNVAIFNLLSVLLAAATAMDP